MEYSLETRLQDAKFKKLYDTCFVEEDFSNLPQVEWEAGKKIATRNAFGDVIAKWAEAVPNLVGGSADLEPSNMTGAFAASSLETSQVRLQKTETLPLA